MHIAGLQKLTLLDFPDRTAATVFASGCNLRCPFCHNAELVFGSSPLISSEEFFAFLDSRKNLLDGICITGGEPLMQKGIKDFCLQIKSRGFAVKLDTNGSFPDRLRALIEAGAIDYVALDVKSAPRRYSEAAGLADCPMAPLEETISLLLDGVLGYEFRTTVVQELHTRENLFEIAHWIKGARSWHLQNFVDSENVLAGKGLLHAWPKADLEKVLPELRAIIPATHIRGV